MDGIEDGHLLDMASRFSNDDALGSFECGRQPVIGGGRIDFHLVGRWGGRGNRDGL